jgi:uncharacterized protein (DUF302 family)
MMTDTTTDYAIRTKLNIPYEQAVEKVTAALKREGFGVLTEIDVKATLKQKLDVEFRDYVILGACNPSLAHQALTAQPDIGLLLPCNVVVSATDGGSEVAILDPMIMMGVVDSPDVKPVAEEAKTRLQRVVQALNAT